MPPKTASGLSGESINQILGINGSSSTGTTSGPPTPSATAVATGDPTAWYYTPEYMAASPQETPGAFGMTGQDVTPTQVTPTTNIYVGDAGVPTPLTQNQLVAAVADKLGLKPQKGVSMEEQIAEKLPAGMKYEPANAKGARDMAPTVNWQAVAQHYGVALTGMPKNPQYKTAGELAAAIAHNTSGDALSGLQQQLYEGGFYDNAIYTDKSVQETPGHVTQWTQKAIGNLLSAVNQYNSENPNGPLTWQQFLSASQNNPNMQGPIGAAKTTTTSVPQATATQLTSTLQSAFEKELGRLPSANDIKAFTQWYDQQQAAAKGVASEPGAPGTPAPLGAGAEQQAQAAAAGNGYIDFNTGIPMLPGVPTASEAAVPFAQSADQNQYLAHQVANSYGLFLNSIIGRTAQKELPGYNPNITSAGSSV